MKTLPFADDIIKKLSPLEMEVIELVHEGKKYGAADIYILLSRKMKVAKSSISVVLDRLYKRGLLQRESETARGGIRFLYSLEHSIERFERNVVENTVNAIVQKFGTKAIAYFNESFNTRKKKRK